MSFHILTVIVRMPYTIRFNEASIIHMHILVGFITSDIFDCIRLSQTCIRLVQIAVVHR